MAMHMHSMYLSFQPSLQAVACSLDLPLRRPCLLPLPSPVQVHPYPTAAAHSHQEEGGAAQPP